MIYCKVRRSFGDLLNYSSVLITKSVHTNLKCIYSENIESVNHNTSWTQFDLILTESMHSAKRYQCFWLVREWPQRHQTQQPLLTAFNEPLPKLVTQRGFYDLYFYLHRPNFFRFCVKMARNFRVMHYYLFGFCKLVCLKLALCIFIFYKKHWQIQECSEIYPLLNKVRVALQFYTQTWYFFKNSVFSSYI